MPEDRKDRREKMAKEAKTNAMRMLDRQKVKYEAFSYECDEFIDGIHSADKEITKITGYVRGGCSPLGMKKPYPVVFDASAGEFEEIYVSGGRIGLTLKVPLADLLKVTGGKLADIIMKTE